MAFPMYPLVGTGQNIQPPITGVSALFSAADQTYMTFTPASTSNNRVMTFACWLRRGNTALNNASPTLVPLIQANNGSTFIGFDSAAQNGDCLYVITPGVLKYEPIDRFNDTTAWFHVCVQIDTTQAVASDRIKTWVNGVQSSNSYHFQNYPALNATLDFNTVGVVNQIAGNSTTNTYFDGYLADIYMLDGIAATPTSFTVGTGANCRPITYSGNVGTNGYHLTMQSGADFGHDSSPQGNDWTPVNLNSTFQQNDSIANTFNLLDVYNTEPPFNAPSFTRALQRTSVNNVRTATSHMAVQSGKWYWELRNDVATNKSVGISYDQYSYVGPPGGTHGAGLSGYPLSWMFGATGVKINSGVGTAYGSAWALNDIIGVALDMDNSRVFFSINGVWQGGGDPVTGANPAFNFTPGIPIMPVFLGADPVTNVSTFNFGGTTAGFSFTPPTGYVAMCSANIPAAVIPNPQDFAMPFTYTGTGAPLNFSSLNFQPDFVFIRRRTGSTGTPLAVYDSARGAGVYLNTSLTNGQTIDAQSLTAFTSNGFTLGTSSASNAVGASYMGLALKANPANGFIVFQYTGDGTTNRSIPHTLGVTPDLMWVKRVDSAGDWYGYFNTFPSQTSYYKPNSSAFAISTSNSPWGTGGITSTQFSVSGDASNNLNVNTATYVVYMWANKTGLYDIDKYAGNAQGAGNLISTLNRPGWVYTVGGASMTDAIYDSARNPFNPTNFVSFFTSSADELTTGSTIDIYSMGFDLRHTGARSNTAATYYYMCIADAPYNTTTAR